MKLNPNKHTNSIVCITLMATLSGCSRSDERLIEMSQQSLGRQAEQNRQMAEQNQQIAEATRRLVEADAFARGELIESHGKLQQGIQSERLSLAEQQADLLQRRDDLELERRQIAQERHRDPLIARALVEAAVLLACSLPLLFCFCLLRTLRQDDYDAGMTELLVEEVLADRSMLFPLDQPITQEPRHKALPLAPPGDIESIA
jgi:hypothetical protein